MSNDNSKQQNGIDGIVMMMDGVIDTRATEDGFHYQDDMDDDDDNLDDLPDTREYETIASYDDIIGRSW